MGYISKSVTQLLCCFFSSYIQCLSYNRLNQFHKAGAGNKGYRHWQVWPWLQKPFLFPKRAPKIFLFTQGQQAAVKCLAFDLGCFFFLWKAIQIQPGIGHFTYMFICMEFFMKRWEGFCDTFFFFKHILILQCKICKVWQNVTVLILNIN